MCVLQKMESWRDKKGQAFGAYLYQISQSQEDLDQSVVEHVVEDRAEFMEGGEHSRESRIYPFMPVGAWRLP